MKIAVSIPEDGYVRPSGVPSSRRSHEGRTRIAAAIRRDDHGAVSVRAIDGDPATSESVDRARRGMAEEVIAADGDDRNAWSDGIEERLRRSVRRAVVTDFEDVRS
jgi:hypothetical protein